ncbi:matrixin family metalloprotease [Flavobacterium foetidum]|uniref:matrixin family metalloprotease n=1 Tax=Flavobacterium foetidum TaxID=2026681 RepID=UPI001ABF11A5|nr:matrixin family metalloprotease [Flavobacterium foetidum]
METKKTPTTDSAFDLNTATFLPAEEYRHIYNNKVICVTDSKGYPEPDNRNPNKIRVDATDGFIPLWDFGVVLNWRFSKSFDSYFKNPETAKNGVRDLFLQATTGWKDACPVKFHEVKDGWDFEIDMHIEDCDKSGCVLASAFFPGAGQNTLYIYPTMFKQSYQEQIETMQHEMGHIFGLRHFFANITETKWKSELFGTDTPFSIMNYGEKSKLENSDIQDLKKLYQLVWSNQLTEINGTPIKKFVSYHMTENGKTGSLDENGLNLVQVNAEATSDGSINYLRADNYYVDQFSCVVHGYSYYRLTNMHNTSAITGCVTKRWLYEGREVFEHVPFTLEPGAWKTFGCFFVTPSQPITFKICSFYGNVQKCNC